MDLLILTTFWLGIPIFFTIALTIECVRRFKKLKTLDKEDSIYAERKKSARTLFIVTFICFVITIDWYITHFILQMPLFYM